MPLIDLQTNLKNLRFGNDRPGYGSSGLPYIQTAIPDTPNATGTFLPLFRPGSTGNLDYPIRGGLAGFPLQAAQFQLGSQTFTLSNQLDKTRIRKFFDDAPRGKAFLEKQIGLQFSNPKIETGNTLFGIPQAFPFPGIVENTRIYNNGVNTLAQVGVSGTGAHATRPGLIPFNPFQKFYYDIVNAQNVENEKQTNRLLILRNLKMTTSTNPFVNPTNVPDINRVNTLGISLNRNLLFQYLGGPGSVYGIGSTTIKRVVDTTKLRSNNAMVYDELAAQKSQFGNANPDLIDFRQTTEGYGWAKNNIINYRFFVNKKDKLNVLYPFAFNNSIAPWEINKTDTDDLIKFVFEAVSNDSPNYSTAIFFRAFLTAGITDNNNAELNSFKYIGRGENFYTYQGFNRTVSFSFRVAAGSRDELKPMYNRVNSLLSQVYPDYSPTTNIMRAPLVRMTIGDYLYRVPGFLENVNITVANDYPWEINLEKSQAGDVAQLPQVIDISVSFKPIMDILPKRSQITDILRSNTYSSILGQTSNKDVTTAYTSTVPLLANSDNNFIEQENSTIVASKSVANIPDFRSDFEKPTKFKTSFIKPIEDILPKFAPKPVTTQKANPFASNFEKSLQNSTFKFNPPAKEPTQKNKPTNNPFGSQFEKAFNTNIGG